MQFTHHFDFEEVAGESLHGELHLDEPDIAESNIRYRNGRLELKTGVGIELCLTHSAATAAFIYIDEHLLTQELRELLSIFSL